MRKRTIRRKAVADLNIKTRKAIADLERGVGVKRAKSIKDLKKLINQF